MKYSLHKHLKAAYFLFWQREENEGEENLKKNSEEHFRNKAEMIKINKN